MESLQNGLQPHSGVTLYFHWGMSLASTQRWLCVNADAWCKRTLRCGFYHRNTVQRRTLGSNDWVSTIPLAPSMNMTRLMSRDLRSVISFLMYRSSAEYSPPSIRRYSFLLAPRSNKLEYLQHSHGFLKKFHGVPLVQPFFQTIFPIRA